MPSFFDFHAHPTAKAFLTDENLSEKKSPWKKIRGGLFQALAPILKSQSNLTQFDEGNVRLAVFPIVPIEKGFSNFFLIENVLSVFTVLSKRFIERINSGHYSYFKLFNDELTFLNRHLIKGGIKVNILKSIDDYKEGDNFINGIIAIEGSHALIDPQGASVLDNLKTVKNASDYSILYLTLTHLTKLEYCNHAYGAKLTKDPIFKPSDNLGINQTGLDIVKTCYEKTHGKRILIDVKHMSVYSRFQFYKYRNENQFSNIPILATHMGCTGFSLANISSFIDEVEHQGSYHKIEYLESNGIKGNKKKFDTKFNPWSINLYDEEIKIILDSDGLIGISLDQRILGFGKNNEEFFASKEYDELDTLLSEFQISSNTGGLEVEEENDLEEEFFEGPDEFEDLEYFENYSNQKGRRRRHLRHLCNTILHIIDVGGEEAWKHICIGSDFDGLINPINNCKSVADYPDLEMDLVEELQIMAGQGNGQYHIRNIEEQVRDLMFNNGLNFLKKHFTSDQLN
jgi:microsomal dipeptidase-like Zn-dependent dipeptidase